jgi:hypothetical protein
MSVILPPNPANFGSPEVWEVASGIDALYMSGKAEVSEIVLGRLQDARRAAEEAEEPLGIEFGGVDFEIAPRNFNKYRFRLEHPFGIVGITPRKGIPAIYIQPKSEFIHRAGIRQVMDFYRGIIRREIGPVELNASRLDLYADVQGFLPSVDDRDLFVCRATSVSSYEDHGETTGLVFGKRKTGTIIARLYNKTIEIGRKKNSFIEQVWNESYEPSIPVARIEFQVGREGLTEYGISTAEEATYLAPALWAALTTDWLSLRVASPDTNRSRWDLAEAWKVVQGVSLRSGAIGLNRMKSDHSNATLVSLLPGLTGYMSSVCALMGGRSLSDALVLCEHATRAYSNISHKTFESRVMEKRGKLSFTIPKELQ